LKDKHKQSKVKKHISKKR